MTSFMNIPGVDSRPLSSLPLTVHKNTLTHFTLAHYFTEGDETRLGYVQHAQGIQPNIPEHTTFIDKFTGDM